MCTQLPKEVFKCTNEAFVHFFITKEKSVTKNSQNFTLDIYSIQTYSSPVKQCVYITKHWKCHLLNSINTTTKYILNKRQLQKVHLVQLVKRTD